MTTADLPINRRAHERYSVPPMYTHVTASRRDDRATKMHGHAYDISERGLRIELDEPVQVGEHLSVSIGLPGTGDISVNGNVVWMMDKQDDPGPRRMALHITDFIAETDRHRLMLYLGTGQIDRAA